MSSTDSGPLQVGLPERIRARMPGTWRDAQRADPLREDVCHTYTQRELSWLRPSPQRHPHVARTRPAPGFYHRVDQEPVVPSDGSASRVF